MATDVTFEPNTCQKTFFRPHNTIKNHVKSKKTVIYAQIAAQVTKNGPKHKNDQNTQNDSQNVRTEFVYKASMKTQKNIYITFGVSETTYTPFFGSNGSIFGAETKLYLLHPLPPPPAPLL